VAMKELIISSFDKWDIDKFRYLGYVSETWAVK